jgi:hypothetical protein
MREYLAGGSCGKIIEEKYVKGRLLGDASASMKRGIWFEFCLTGAIPKNGEIPQPEYMKSALDKNKNSTIGLSHKDMYEPYRQAADDAKVIKGYMDAWGLKIISIGKTLTKGRFRGTLDLIVDVVLRDGVDVVVELDREHARSRCLSRPGGEEHRSENGQRGE